MVGPLPSTLGAQVHCCLIGLGPNLSSLQYASIDEALKFIFVRSPNAAGQGGP